MRKFAVLAVLSIFSVGCAGASKQQVSDLETSLAACETEKTTLAADRDRLETELAEARRYQERSEALATARMNVHTDLQEGLAELVEAGTVGLVIRHGVVTVTIPTDTLFARRQTEVKKDQRAVLNQVAKALEPIRDHRFYVSGHTDNGPAKKKVRKYGSNPEVATMRALKVQEILLASGLQDERTVVAGWSDTDPVASNDGEETMAQNRRIEIMVVPTLESLMPAVVEVAAAPAAAPAEAEAGAAAEGEAPAEAAPGAE